MLCPFCSEKDTKVIDSRLVAAGEQIRRRRECIVCLERFTTFESAELVLPKLIKQNGAREPFNEDKLRNGMMRALERRPVSVDEVESSIIRIMAKLRATGERELPALDVGEHVMSELKKLDQVAFVRFASVYRRFEDVDQFTAEIKNLNKNTKQDD